MYFYLRVCNLQETYKCMFDGTYVIYNKLKNCMFICIYEFYNKHTNVGFL